MNGSAPKSPVTGFHAERRKNPNPNCDRLSLERAIKIVRINSTIAKMLSAHTSITAAKVPSASPPLPRALRYCRIGEGGPSAAAGSGAATKLTIAGAWSGAASIACEGAVSGDEGSGSLSRDMDDGVTIYLLAFGIPNLEAVILSAANGAPGQLDGWGRKNPRISYLPLLVLSRNAPQLQSSPKNHAARPQSLCVRAALTVYLMVAIVFFTIACTCAGSGA